MYFLLSYVLLGLFETKLTEQGPLIQSLSKETQVEACTSISKILRQHRSDVVSNVIGIPKARVPIVKFVHMKTGLSCDLSFKHKMSVLNTEWIRLCGEADSRARAVMVAIRYWASIYGLSGGGKGARVWKITNYALTLLIIFYLQVGVHGATPLT